MPLKDPDFRFGTIRQALVLARLLPPPMSRGPCLGYASTCADFFQQPATNLSFFLVLSELCGAPCGWKYPPDLLQQRDVVYDKDRCEEENKKVR